MQRRKWVVPLAMVALVVSACGSSGAATDVGPAAAATSDAPPITGAAPGSFDIAGAPGALENCRPQDMELYEPGTLTIAMSDNPTPPWMVGEPGNGLGFDSGVAAAIADKLGFTVGEVKWVEAGADEMLAAGPKQYDFSIAHHRIIDEETAVEYSAPYYQMKRVIVALPGTPAAEASALSHLDGLVLGTADGISDTYAQSVGAAETVTDTAEGVLTMLVNGDVEAAILDLPAAIDLATIEIPNAAIGVLPRNGDEGPGFGAVFQEGSGLVDCVNAAIADLETGGVLAGIGEAWLEESGEFREILADSIQTVEATENEVSDADFAYLIPAGTDDLIDQGVVIEIMPSDLTIVVGQVIEIVNEDDTGYAIGPFYVGPGETLRQRFQSAGEYVGECGVSATGTIALRVTES